MLLSSCQVQPDLGAIYDLALLPLLGALGYLNLRRTRRILTSELYRQQRAPNTWHMKRSKVDGRTRQRGLYSTISGPPTPLSLRVLRETVYAILPTIPQSYTMMTLFLYRIWKRQIRTKNLLSFRILHALLFQLFFLAIIFWATALLRNNFLWQQTGQPRNSARD